MNDDLALIVRKSPTFTRVDDFLVTHPSSVQVTEATTDDHGRLLVTLVIEPITPFLTVAIWRLRPSLL